EFERHRLAPRYVRYRILDEFPRALSLEWQSVAIVVTELVANAVQHGGAPGRMNFWVDDQQARIEVFDCSLEGVPVVQHPSARTGWKFGLNLISQLATAWGVDVTSDGKTVWAEVDIAPPATRADP
ncbi:MAG: serine/threonine protein phosphatase, partial [Ilumatobacteraceae bacterium]|nr:serine/threonine protein phosphatase [Ilumatobacteraceae bacterium]